MVGSERLSQLRLRRTTATGTTSAPSSPIALGLAHDDLGVTYVRAHAILHDDNAVVVRADDGTLQFDFDAVDEHLRPHPRPIGIRPVVELSFMPAALARDPDQTVFTYRGIISPPADWSRVARPRRRARRSPRRSLRHRRGRAPGGSRCGTRPTSRCSGAGTQPSTCACTPSRPARSRASTPSLRVGGPSTAAVGMDRDRSLPTRSPRTCRSTSRRRTRTATCRSTRARRCDRHGFDGAPIWWTEWGVGSTHFGPIHDTAFGAPFVLSGYAAVQGRLDALAYWVISDHFEELGRPPRLFHDGFGLLSVGNLRKPRYWAVHLAAHLGRPCARQLGSTATARTCSSRPGRPVTTTARSTCSSGTAPINADAGRAAIPAWTARSADPRTTWPPASYRPAWPASTSSHSNVVDSAARHRRRLAGCRVVGAAARPRRALRRTAWPRRPVDGTAHFDFELPMPGVARIRLSALRPARPVRMRRTAR